MIAPTTFGYDEQTAQTNTFQHEPTVAQAEVTTKALDEFKTAVATLRQHDITVVDFYDSDGVVKPNAVFPNNWLSTWPDGRVYLYPMATPSRRVERSSVVLDLLRSKFEITAITDLSSTEKDEQFLESTGVLVFDHSNKIVYGCLSPRCDEVLFKQHVRDLGYEPLTFHASIDDTAIYHTNVVLAVQDKTAILCSAALTDNTERQALVDSLTKTTHIVIDITPDQLEHFCGNVLAVKNTKGQTCVVLSQTAYDAFTPEQRTTLSESGELVAITIPTIEAVGGGSARCMLAEIFLPSRSDKQ